MKENAKTLNFVVYKDNALIIVLESDVQLAILAKEVNALKIMIFLYNLLIPLALQLPAYKELNASKVDAFV